MMVNGKYFLYSLTSAILLSLPWLFQFPGWILFIGFVPLFLLEDRIGEWSNKNTRFLLLNNLFAGFFLWNLLSAWWLGYATMVGLVLFLFLNTILMTSVWYLYFLLKLRTREDLAIIFLLVLWLSFEFLHLNWDMQLPGMILGGAFGNQVEIVQWYEYTGVLGGSFWVLVVNVFIYKTLKYFRSFREISFPLLISSCTVVLLPMILSLVMYVSYSEKGDEFDIAVLQPNIDPYTEKFGSMSFDRQLEKLLFLIDSIQTEPLSFIVGPETAIAPFWEDSLDANPAIQAMKQRVEKFDHTSIIIGANTLKVISDSHKITNTSRLAPGSKLYYEEYNSAIQLDSNDSATIYHKNILVSGVEKVPFSKYFGFLKNYFFDLGGTSGGLAVGEPINFYSKKGIQVSPLICFESMFGQYLGGLIKQGGELIFVMTNDGWWRKSTGAGLHFSYSRLRAVEMRRSVARSANTGISGFINQRGDVLSKTRWWSQTAIHEKLSANQSITFYAEHGDYIGRIAVFTATLLLLFLLSGKKVEKRKQVEKL